MHQKPRPSPCGECIQAGRKCGWCTDEVSSEDTIKDGKWACFCNNVHLGKNVMGGKPFPVVRLFVYPSLWRTSCDSANNSGCKNLFWASEVSKGTVIWSDITFVPPLFACSWFITHSFLSNFSGTWAHHTPQCSWVSILCDHVCSCHVEQREICKDRKH